MPLTLTPAGAARGGAHRRAPVQVPSVRQDVLAEADSQGASEEVPRGTGPSGDCQFLLPVSGTPHSPSPHRDARRQPVQRPILHLQPPPERPRPTTAKKPRPSTMMMALLQHWVINVRARRYRSIPRRLLRFKHARMPQDQSIAAQMLQTRAASDTYQPTYLPTYVHIRYLYTRSEWLE